MDPTFGIATFEVCSLDDLMRNLMDDDPDEDEMYEDGIVGAIQRSGIDAPTGIGAKDKETLGMLTKAAISNSTDGRFTYWDKEDEDEARPADEGPEQADVRTD
jgi:hypothetical protein